MNITPIFGSYSGKRAGNAHQQCQGKQVKFKPFHKNYLMVNKDPGSRIGVATRIFLLNVPTLFAGFSASPPFCYNKTFNECHIQ